MKNEKGFTLIELLVVIAIIGILASVVLASLNNARTKGNDAALKSNLASVRVQAEMYYDTTGSYRNGTGAGPYAGDCLTSGTVFRNIVQSAEVQALSAPVAGAIQAAYVAGGSTGKECRTDDGGTKYLIAVKMRSGSYWCIDNAGAAKDIGAALPTAGVYICS